MCIFNDLTKSKYACHRNPASEPFDITSQLKVFGFYKIYFNSSKC